MVNGSQDRESVWIMNAADPHGGEVRPYIASRFMALDFIHRRGVLSDTVATSVTRMASTFIASSRYIIMIYK